MHPGIQLPRWRDRNPYPRILEGVGSRFGQASGLAYLSIYLCYARYVNK